MKRVAWLLAWLLALLLLAAACGEGGDPSVQATAASPAQTSTAFETTTSTVLATTTSTQAVPTSPPVTVATTLVPQNQDCVPTVPAVVDLPGDPNRIFEDIVHYLTGERQTGDEDSIDVTVDDPNFGGVWGDFAGGVVVAVLDCSLVDANKIAEMAGGSGRLHLIEVPYTFQQVNAFVRVFYEEMIEGGIQGSLPVDSTLSGRFITVQICGDIDALPQDFGSQVPDDIYQIVEVEECGGEY